MKVTDILEAAPTLNNAHSNALRAEVARLSTEAAAKQTAADTALANMQSASPADKGAAKAAYKQATKDLKAANAELKQANKDLATDTKFRRKEIDAYNRERDARLQQRSSGSSGSSSISASNPIKGKVGAVMKWLKIIGRITILHELTKPLTDYIDVTNKIGDDWEAKAITDQQMRASINAEEKRLSQRLIAEITVILATQLVGKLGFMIAGGTMKALKFIFTLGFGNSYAGMPKVAAFFDLVGQFGTEQLLQYMNSAEGQKTVASIMSASILNTFSDVGAKLIDEIDYNIGPSIREKDPTGIVGLAADGATAAITSADKLGREIEKVTPNVTNTIGGTSPKDALGAGLVGKKVDPASIPRAEKPLSAYANAQAPKQATTQPGAQQGATSAPITNKDFARDTGGAALATPASSFNVGVGQKITPQSQEGWVFYKPGYVINPQTREVQPKL